MDFTQALTSLKEDKYIQTMYKKEVEALERSFAKFQEVPVEAITAKLEEALAFLKGEAPSKSKRKTA